MVFVDETDEIMNRTFRIIFGLLFMIRTKDTMNFSPHVNSWLHILPMFGVLHQVSETVMDTQVKLPVWRICWQHLLVKAWENPYPVFFHESPRSTTTANAAS